MEWGGLVLHTVSWRSHTNTIFSFHRDLMNYVGPTLPCSMNGLTVQLQAKWSVDPRFLCWFPRELPPLYFLSGNLAFHSYKAT